MVREYDLSGLVEIRSGAAALGKDMEKELKERFVLAKFLLWLSEILF